MLQNCALLVPLPIAHQLRRARPLQPSKYRATGSHGLNLQQISQEFSLYRRIFMQDVVHQRLWPQRAPEFLSLPPFLPPSHLSTAPSFKQDLNFCTKNPPRNSFVLPNCVRVVVRTDKEKIRGKIDKQDSSFGFCRPGFCFFDSTKI